MATFGRKKSFIPGKDGNKFEPTGNAAMMSEWVGGRTWSARTYQPDKAHWGTVHRPNSGGSGTHNIRGGSGTANSNRNIAGGAVVPTPVGEDGRALAPHAPKVAAAGGVAGFLGLGDYMPGMSSAVDTNACHGEKSMYEKCMSDMGSAHVAGKNCMDYADLLKRCEDSMGMTA